MVFASGPLAQLVEQQTLNLRVEGSNPSRLNRTFLRKVRPSPSGVGRCGNSSVVERHLAKVDVAGPTPVSRFFASGIPDAFFARRESDRPTHSARHAPYWAHGAGPTPVSRFSRPVFRTLFFCGGSRTVQPIPLDMRPTGRMSRVRLPFPAFLRPVFRTLFLPGRPALRSRGASAARAAARGCVDSIRVFPLHSGSRPTPSESGEIGRHARLRIWCRRRKGSSPFSRMPIGGVKGRHECGNSSVVERHLAKVDVAGPTPVSRSQAESDPMSGSLFLYRPPSPAGFHPPVGLILGRA